MQNIPYAYEPTYIDISFVVVSLQRVFGAAAAAASAYVVSALQIRYRSKTISVAWFLLLLLRRLSRLDWLTLSLCCCYCS
jgi:hypothetical protein